MRLECQALVVGQPILAAAAFQAASSSYARVFALDERRLSLQVNLAAVANLVANLRSPLNPSPFSCMLPLLPQKAAVLALGD
jgi:hypothetical protein